MKRRGLQLAGTSGARVASAAEDPGPGDRSRAGSAGWTRRSLRLEFVAAPHGPSGSICRDRELPGPPAADPGIRALRHSVD